MDQALEVLSIEPHGLWVCAYGKNLFLTFKDYPRFSAAPVEAVFNVEPWGCEGLRWPDLDVDLHMASIQNPELYPLISQVKPVVPAVMDAAMALHDGDASRALLWLQRPARALGGVRPVDYQDSPEHIQAVLDIIVRIEHGVLN
ncbi:antitoxin Xre/MbcA/ParS toxin-binding domain-containing protein [Aeromonas caviae]|uniref:antitoxin Xre/MbcA/ParS toxin-binding domain-containing protein n=1 Tax=Aeromonas caviae TaxID=648 RepID=UPI0025B6FB9B|nr:antitoxin Xre/MbcA/ParS toxin-binding domain-containing protein [Aeromonas caviae]